MAAADPSLGPRYAPVDPTLPKPWLGLIDGSSGLKYYWNPETNVTQYEKPASLTPQLPQSAVSSVPKLAPIPGSQREQLTVMQGQSSAETYQFPGSQVQNEPHSHTIMVQQQNFPQYQGQQSMPQNQLIQQQQQQRVQYTGQQTQPQFSQQAMHQHSHQMSHQIGQQATQNSQMPQPLGQHQSQYVAYQQTDHAPQVQQSPLQPDYQGGHPKTDDRDYNTSVNPVKYSPTHPQHLGSSYASSLPAGINSNQNGLSGQVQRSSDSAANPMLPTAQMQKGSTNFYQQQQDHRFQNHTDTSFMQGQRPNFIPGGGKTEYEDNQNFRASNEYYSGGSKEGYNAPQHPKLASIPMAKNQEARMDSTTFNGPPRTAGGSGHSGGSGYNALPGQARDSGFSVPLTHVGRSEYNMVPGHAGGSVLNAVSRIRFDSAPGHVGGPGLISAPGHTGGTAYNAPPGHHGGTGFNSALGHAVGTGFSSAAPGLAGVSGFSSTPGHIGDSRFSSVPGHTTQNIHLMPNSSLARPPVTGLGPADAGLSADLYRKQHDVTITGDNVPAPFMTFEATGFPPEILKQLRHAGFASPTPIQAQTWPIAVQSKDIVAIAKTGSGKTLGYLIPAFILLTHRRNHPQNGPTVLVLAPTRELATQIQDEAIKFGGSSRFSCTCLYGGAPKGPQLKELDRGADIVVATPGRLNDILEMKKINFGQISLLVLDEADRMLDMGFEPQIRKIVNEIPPRRQTLMYTATWPKEVRKIAGDLLVNPVQVNIGNVDELAANKSITQYVEVVPQMEKQRRLEQILREQERGSKAIIFCSTKKLCDHLAYSLGRGFGAAAIHGDKSQSERDSVLNQFRSGRSPILVATDVAARGLDIKDIRVVINYDFPNGVEDYIHRIGRTGRAGATGVAYTFFSDQDWKHASDLVKVLEGANQCVPPEVREMALHGGPSYGKDQGGGFNRFDSGGNIPGRWDSGGRGGSRDGSFAGPRGIREGGFGGRGGIRDGSFAGHGDGGYGGRGGMRDGGFGGRGGRDGGGFGGRGGFRDAAPGGRDDIYGGRGGNRNRDFGGPGGGRGRIGFDLNNRGSCDRYSMEGQGRGRGRSDGRRPNGDRSRGRSRSRSPDRVRTWGRDSRSRSRSRSHSRSRSRSRRRSWSRSRSRGNSWSRSRSVSRSRSRTRSPSPSRYRRRRESGFDKMDPAMTQTAPISESQVLNALPNEISTPAGADATEQAPVSHSGNSVDPGLGLNSSSQGVAES